MLVCSGLLLGFFFFFKLESVGHFENLFVLMGWLGGLGLFGGLVLLATTDQGYSSSLHLLAVGVVDFGFTRTPSGKALFVLL